MTLISTTKDPQALTMTMVTQFDATPEQVWDLWEDPRKLERWWGPPTYPASFTRHEFVVGGESRYHMTGPAGDKHHGWWRMAVLDEPMRLEFANGLAGEDGEPVRGLEPMGALASFEDLGGSTRMTVMTKFTDIDQMQAMLDRGMQEGMIGALSQIDGLLGAPAPLRAVTRNDSSARAVR